MEASFIAARLSCGFRTWSSLKNQTRGGAVGKQTPLAIGDVAFGGANPTAAAQHHTLRPDHPCLRGDGPITPVSGVMGRTSEILNSSVVWPTPFSRVDWMASPMQLSSSVAVKPPCTVPAGLR